MKAGEIEFLSYLEGSNKNFIIPVYQRNYNWKKEQCKRLFDDLEDIINSGLRTHFLGSVVSIYGMGKEYLIIDGQQRVTTMSILLLAMCQIIRELGQSRGIITTEEQIKECYLINKHSRNEEGKIKLKPIVEDRKAYYGLFEEEINTNQNSNIVSNYLYFYNRIREDNISVDDLFDAIQKLIIVEIELKSGEDDPQLIFESLNSTGLDLSEADRVRNFVLMGRDSKAQEEFYNNYWYRIEKNTKNNVSSFIRDYLTIKERNIPNKNKVHVSFKRYVSDNDINIEYLLKDLLKFSNYYKEIFDSSTSNSEVNEVLKRVNKLEIFVSYPFLLELFDDYNENILSTDQLIEALNLVECFILRRIICDVPTNALNKIFMNLGREIKKSSDYRENYSQILKYTFINKKSSQRFPDDNEFSNAFETKDIYNTKSKNKLYLLERLENYNNKERVDLENLINDNTLNIEHIMPQTLTNKWKESLGENYKEIHNKYLHTIGNLTLTGYNSKLSNKTFEEKKEMESGFKDSRLYLNKYISAIEKWSEEEIKNRTKILLNRALEIWKYPSTIYEPPRNSENLFTLEDEDINFTNESIVSFSILGECHKVKNWTEFYEQAAFTLYDLDPVRFNNIIDRTYKRDIIDNNKSREVTKLRKGTKISDNIYLETNLNTEAKLNIIRFLLKEFDIELNEVVFSIK
ncbi:GmrSD restriction endonuclease domain-containing protein [Asaccharospora irregularis]